MTEGDKRLVQDDAEEVADAPNDVPPSIEFSRVGLASTFGIFSLLSTKTVVAVATLGLAIEVAIGWRIGLTAALPAYLFFGLVGWFLALIDTFERRIPNLVILPSYPIAIALLVIASALEGKWFALLRGGLGMLLLATFYLVLAIVRSGELGFGDVKLAGWLGLVLGWLGWNVLFVGAIAGPALGALGAAALLVGHRGGRSTSFPFGPFLIAGALVGILIR